MFLRLQAALLLYFGSTPGFEMKTSQTHGPGVLVLIPSNPWLRVLERKYSN